jgi:hypothetical protein
MSVADLIRAIHWHGAYVTVDGDDLHLSAPQPLPADLVDQIRKHKMVLLHYLNKDIANTDDPDDDVAAEARRQMVLAMLKENPGITNAITSDTEIEADAVIITLAIRDKATCELRIPKAKYDAFALLRVMEAHTGPTANILRGKKGSHND